MEGSKLILHTAFNNSISFVWCVFSGFSRFFFFFFFLVDEAHKFVWGWAGRGRTFMKQLLAPGPSVSYLDRDFLSSTSAIRNGRYCIYLLKRDQSLIQHSWKFNTWLQEVCLGFTNYSLWQVYHDISNINPTLDLEKWN